MLHIILFILKIIGCILLILLGLVLLILLTVLFVPFCYRVKASCKGTADTLAVGAAFSWLFQLIRCRILYEDGKLKWRLYIAWKKFPAGKKQKKKKRKKEKAKKGTAEPTSPKEEATDKLEESPSVEEVEKKAPDVAESFESGEVLDKVEPSESGEVLDKAESSESGKVPDKEEPSGTGKTSVEKKLPENRKVSDEEESDEDFFLYKIWEKMRYTFRKICDTIKALTEKKEEVLAFLSSDVHRGAFQKGLKELKKLFSCLRPKRLEAQVKFGFEDPALTGYTLAGISIIYPFIGEHAQVEADFENKVLEGQVFLEGKIRGVYLARFAWNMLWDKNVRKTFFIVRETWFPIQ